MERDRPPASVAMAVLNERDAHRRWTIQLRDRLRQRTGFPVDLLDQRRTSDLGNENGQEPKLLAVLHLHAPMPQNTIFVPIWKFLGRLF